MAVKASATITIFRIDDDPFIIGTQTATTGSWTGVAPFDALTDGQKITYWLPYAGNGNATLNLTLSDGTTTGAVACYYGGTTRLTTHYPAGSAIRLTYRKSVTIGSGTYTGWWGDANYDTGNTYDRTRYACAVKAETAITSGSIIVGTSSGYHNLKTGAAFDITYPILWAGSSISASGTGTNNYIIVPFSVSTTQSITLTAYKSVYIKGTLSGTTFTPVSTTPLTQTIPTSDDGYYYILLGTAYSTTSMYLIDDHAIFRYFNGAFKSTTQIAIEAQENLDDLEVGGRNLIKNSNFSCSTTSWIVKNLTGWVVADDTYGYAIKLNTSVADDTSYRIYPSVDTNFTHISGTLYSLSFMAKADSAATLQTNVANTTNKKEYSLTTEWQRFTHTYTAGTGGSLTFYPATTDVYMYITNVKIEIGSFATDWTPAPEDMATAEGLDQTQQAVEDVNLEVSSRFELLEDTIATLSESMSNLVIDESGMSLMEQVGDGYQFSMGKFIDALQGVADQIEAAEVEIDSQGGDIMDLQEAMQSLAVFDAYMRVGSDVDGNPYLELGNRSSLFNIQITNTSIDFRNDDTILAYITNDALQINKADVEDELAFGGFAFKKRSNGNMGLIWKG